MFLFHSFSLIGQAKLPERNANGRIKWNKNGEASYKKVPCDETVPNIDFIKKHKLDFNSHPADWMNAFLPKHPIAGSHLSLHDITSWTNMKAWLTDGKSSRTSQ